MTGSRTFAEVLSDHLEKSGVAIGRLAKLTNIPRASLINWLEGHVRRPHQWQPIVAIAKVLRLTVAETTELLQSARHRSLAQLVEDETGDKERVLFQAWLDELRRPASIDLPAALALLRTMPTDAVPERAPLSARSIMPYGPNPLFTGREDNLNAIARAVGSGKDVVIGPMYTSAVTGLGGIGKTDLAIEVVHRYGQYFAGGVYWLSLADPNAVASEVAACGGIDGLELRPDFEQLSQNEQVKLVRAAWQESMPRLLVFDNCEDEALLRTWRPTTGGCRVLVTSRRETWDVKLGVQVHALEVLSRAESVALLRKYREDLVDEFILHAIAYELADLPLALTLAGAYLNRYRYEVTPAAYLEQLRQAKIQDHPEADISDNSPAEHARIIARSFGISRERLRPEHPPDRLAIALMERIACCAPGEPVPRGFAIDSLVHSEEAIADRLKGVDAIVRLRELGLVESVTSGALRMHRLLCAFVQNEPEIEQARADVEQTLIELADRANAALEIEPVRAIQQHLRFVTDAAFPRHDEGTAALCHALGYHLMFLGEFVKSQQYIERAITIRRALPTDYMLKLADSLEVLGFILQGTSKLEQPKALYRQVLAIREPILGPEHIETVDAHDNLGYLLMLEGSFAQAHDYLRHAMRMRHREFGLCHSRTARSVHNYGTVLFEMGHYRTADRFLSLALALREEVLSPSHFSTLQTMSHLGTLKCIRGDYVRARQLHERALAQRRDLFGDIHQDIAESLLNLANISHAVGDLAQAREQLERALAINRVHFGDEHRETQGIVVPLGNVLREQGHLEEAQACFDEAIPILDRTLGPRHPGALEARHSLGRLMAARGDIEQARALLTETLALRREVRGPTHFDTGRSLQYLGEVLEQLGEQEDATNCYREALDVYLLRLGTQHPMTATLRAQLSQ